MKGMLATKRESKLVEKTLEDGDCEQASVKKLKADV